MEEVGRQPDAFDSLLKQVEAADTEQVRALINEEDALLVQIFGDSASAFGGQALYLGHLIEEWENWPKEKQEILHRCERAGVFYTEFSRPDEVSFQLWVTVARSLPFGKDAPETVLRKEFFDDFKPAPLVFITAEGVRILGILMEASRV